VVIVTGGSQGMGKSVAILLAQKGAHIAIVARNQQRLTEALEEIRAARRDDSQKFFSYSADLTSGPQTVAAFEAIQAELGTPDVVWQCAGATKPGYFKDYTSEDLEREIAMNYFTALHTAHAAVRMMTANPKKDNEKRHIVLTSSVLAFYPIAGYNSYSPAKAAIRLVVFACATPRIGVH
jgi:3-dehydrosphinganine reductase